jgi:hypothetical protein
MPRSWLVCYNNPAQDENPFFCLFKVTVETDMLLEPIAGTFNVNDARLIIQVGIRPYSINPSNENFA